MLGLIYCFTKDWVDVSTGSVSSTDIFRCAAKSFGVTDICIVNETDYELPGGDGSLVNHEVKSIAEGLALYPDAKKIFVECPRSLKEMGLSGADLKHFGHPAEDVVYIFGSDMSSIPKNLFQLGDTVVIDTPLSMWAISAISIVLHDRWQQWQ